MEVLRYQYIIVILIFLKISNSYEKSIDKKNITSIEHSNCPFSKIIEDIFKIHNKSSDTGIYLKDSERAKIFLNSIANVTMNDNDSNVTDQESLVDNIIASINRIKNNITSDNNNETNINEAIILDIPSKRLSGKTDVKSSTEVPLKIVTQIKSGIEEKLDVTQLKNHSDTFNSIVGESSNKISISSTTTEKTNYVEILTIEPNNTNAQNTSSHNIIEVLKHLMPMFNSTLTKELHNITIIERNHHKNHSFTATKNVSTIVVTYCDKENLTKINVTNEGAETDIKVPTDIANGEDYVEDNFEAGTSDYDDIKPANGTSSVKKEILEAAEYGMQKMHELYTVLEPKLYSMGLWLDDTNPARYVAAFNAPTEDAAKYSRYGYASLQAAQKLKQLIRGAAKPASRTVIAGWIKTLFREFGIVATPGSVRSAVASKSWLENHPLEDILARGNWRSADTFKQYYRREVMKSLDSDSITKLFEPIT